MNRNKRLSISIVSNIIAVGVSLSISFFMTPYLINSIVKKRIPFIRLPTISQTIYVL